MVAQWHRYAGEPRPVGAGHKVRQPISGPRTPASLSCSPPFESLWRRASLPRVLANELNRRGITGARAGRWHRSSVRRMLTRLRQLTSKHGGTDNNLGWTRVADLRAEALRPTIYNLRKAGFVSISAIAREVNKRGIPTPRGGKWHMTMVTRLLERLDRLDRVARSQRRR